MDKQRASVRQGGAKAPAETSDSARIDAALSQFESCLESPVIPGELPSWAAAVEQTYRGLGGPLRREIEDTHRDQLAQITSEETDLLAQVQQLREEDAQLGEVYQAFGNDIRAFRKQAERVEPHEGKLAERLTRVVNDGLALVIRIRKQQRAIRTWLLEAFNRDTGVGG
jgi:Spy/CpxP family protein refolding chaperone